ncbi:MAG TPA: hypothetical protein VF937_07780 [Chloroflexota bacterium]
MWLLFIPVVVVLALIFTAASLVAGTFWLVGSGWPWLLIGLGVWLYVRGDNRRDRARYAWSGRHSRTRFYGGPRAAQAAASPSVDRAAVAPEGTRAPTSPIARNELPIDVQVKVEQIRRKVEVLLSYADRFPPFSRDLFLVRQTASDYLPRTIAAYLALPAQAVDRPLGADGKTALQELTTQLELLDTKLDEIAQDLQRQDADRLLANRRFLEARFGGRGPRPFSSPVQSADVA